MNITNKTSKRGLVEYVKDNMGKCSKVKSLAKDIKATMDTYTKRANDVSKEKLFALVTNIRATLGEQVNILDLVAPTEPKPVENSLKIKTKTKKVTPKVSTKMEEIPMDDIMNNIFPDKEVEEVEEETPKKKKTALKSSKNKKTITEKVKDSVKVKAKEKEVKKIEVTSKAIVNKKQLDLAENFPEQFEIENVGKMTVDTSEITMESIYERFHSGEFITFAMYWSKRHLKQYTYDNYNILEAPIKEFPHNLDVCQLIHVSDKGRVLYVTSVYTDIVYTITPQNLEFEDGMRFSAGMEYNIYTVE